MITLTPLTPLIGAEVGGVDLAVMDEATWNDVQRAFADHLVLFFRDQNLTPDTFLEFGARFGPAHIRSVAQRLDGYPELQVVHADEHTNPIGTSWHSDSSCDERPPLATALWMRTVPPTGGDTLFASMYAAWDALSPSMQTFLDGKFAVHDAHAGRADHDRTSDNLRDDEPSWALHPIARTHPVTGRKALYVNPVYTMRIDGLEPAQSRAVLAFLFGHLENPEFQCRFQWEPNSVALWDNRCAQHCAMNDYHPAVRSGLRRSILGERPA